MSDHSRKHNPEEKYFRFEPIREEYPKMQRIAQIHAEIT